MPRFVHPLDDITPGEIGRHGGVERDVAIPQVFEKRVPLCAMRCDQTPLSGHLAKARLLVLQIGVRRPRLYLRVVVHRFEDAVEMRHRFEAQFRGHVGVHLRDTLLLQMRR